ncbi:MAG: hypothetical protein LUQ71_07830 [Methanoregula sp.]|nr:hypothetical protein [Methanoregula sp.]
MTTPYLDRGESIILTTHRLSVSSVMYDALLTNERLILMDSRYTRFEPRTILFPSIITVKGGKVPEGEPAIILTLEEHGDLNESDQVNLIFTQQPGETRKHERDLWVKKLIEMVITAREKAAQKAIVPAREKTGMQPTIRRWVAPEPLRPHTSIDEPAPLPPKIEVISEEPDSMEFFLEEQNPKRLEPVVEESHREPPAPEVLPATVEPDNIMGVEPEFPEQVIVRGLPPKEPTPAIDLPADEDQPRSENTTGAEPSPFPENIPVELTDDIIHGAPAMAEPSPDIGPSASFASLVLAVTQSLQTPEKPKIPDTDTTILPDTHEPGEIQPAEPPGHDTPTKERQDDTSERDTTETPRAPEPDQHPEPVVISHLPPPGQARELPGTYTPNIPATGIAMGHHASEPPINTPYSHKSVQDPKRRKRTIVAGALILVALLVVVGGIIILSLYPMSYGDSGQVTVITPAITVTQIPTHVPEVTQAGVRVNVIYTGIFTGTVGNPGFLHQVSGTGNQTFPVLMNTDIIQATIQKQDYLGDALTVEIYDNSTLLSKKTVTAPMGEVNLLIDVKTGMSPGLTTDKTPGSSQALQGNATLIYF